MEKKKAKSPTSPVGSVHSKTSAHELFSPTGKALGDMFSPSHQEKIGEVSSMFGGPALNIGGGGLYLHFYLMFLK